MYIFLYIIIQTYIPPESVSSRGRFNYARYMSAVHDTKWNLSSDTFCTYVYPRLMIHIHQIINKHTYSNLCAYRSTYLYIHIH